MWRPSTGQWWVLGRSTPVQWGQNGDVPLPADYTGDGRAGRAVWRPSTGQWWWIHGRSPVQWGQPGDVPLVGDYTGDGRAGRAVWRPSTGTWWDRGIATVTYGTSSDIPINAAPAYG